MFLPSIRYGQKYSIKLFQEINAALRSWKGEKGRIELVHVNVADYDYDDVNKGWEVYYWNPWREYLKRGK